MIRKNQNIKTIINFAEVNGFGTVHTKIGYQDTFVFGYFKKWHWTFIVHRNVLRPELITVSEASTGYNLANKCFYDVEEALCFSASFLDDKRYYLSTTVGDILVKTKCDLLRRNRSLQTIGVDTLLWM